MAMVIKPKRKFTAGAPTTSDLVEGEIAVNTADKKLYVRDNSNNIIEIGGGGGGSTSDITQSSHGFAVKDAIRHNGSAWVKAQANASSTLALGIVTAVADSNNFTIAQSGRFELSSHGLTVGQWYYLSAAAAGGLVTTEPAISQPIIYVESANFVYVYQYRPTNLLINSDGLTPGDNTVTSAKIVNGTIVAADLADDAVTTAKIADDAITSALIADDAITSALIADDAIISALIADDAVVAAAIADNSVDIARLNVSDGSNGQVLKTDGAGNLGFVSINTPGAAASFTQVDITAEGDLRLQDASGGQFVALEAPSTIGSSYTLELPAADGSNGQFLSTNGSGALSFATAGGAYTGWAVKTGAYTAVAGDQLIVNSASAVTITLPASPSVGDTVVVKARGGGTVTLGRNSSNFESGTTDGTLFSGSKTQVVYIDATIGWEEL